MIDHAPRRKVGWTAHEDEALRQMAACGRTSAQIADAIGRTKDAVDTRKRILNGTRGPRKGRPRPAVRADARIRQLQATIEKVKAERHVDQELLREYRTGLLALVRRRGEGR